MNEVKLRTTAHLKAFLAGTELLKLRISTAKPLDKGLPAQSQ